MIDVVLAVVIGCILVSAAYFTRKETKSGGCAGCSGCPCGEKKPCEK